MFGFLSKLYNMLGKTGAKKLIMQKKQVFMVGSFFEQ